MPDGVNAIQAALDNAEARRDAYRRADQFLTDRAEVADAEIEILISALLDLDTVGRYPDTVVRALFDARRELALLRVWAGASA